MAARFEAERQALPMMDHPITAKVLVAGMTLGAPASHRLVPQASPHLHEAARETPALPAGRPYFVMERVRGLKMTASWDQANFATHDRLDLFTTLPRGDSAEAEEEPHPLRHKTVARDKATLAETQLKPKGARSGPSPVRENSVRPSC